MTTPIKSLHPTLKACKCGLIASRKRLYKHLAELTTQFQGNTPEERTASWKEFFAKHGEVPLNAGDPRTVTPILVTDSNFAQVFPSGWSTPNDERNPE
jgi:hypothetical protein